MHSPPVPIRTPTESWKKYLYAAKSVIEIFIMAAVESLNLKETLHMLLTMPELRNKFFLNTIFCLLGVLQTFLLDDLLLNSIHNKYQEGIYSLPQYTLFTTLAKTISLTLYLLLLLPILILYDIINKHVFYYLKSLTAPSEMKLFHAPSLSFFSSIVCEVTWVLIVRLLSVALDAAQGIQQRYLPGALGTSVMITGKTLILAVYSLESQLIYKRVLLEWRVEYIEQNSIYFAGYFFFASVALYLFQTVFPLYYPMVFLFALNVLMIQAYGVRPRGNPIVDGKRVRVRFFRPVVDFLYVCLTSIRRLIRAPGEADLLIQKEIEDLYFSKLKEYDQKVRRNTFRT